MTCLGQHIEKRNWFSLPDYSISGACYCVQ